MVGGMGTREVIMIGRVVWVLALISGGCAAPPPVTTQGESPPLVGEPCPEEACDAYGRCGRDAEGVCRPQRKEDCLLATVLCEKMGACSFQDGACRVASRDDLGCEVPRGQFEVDWCRTAGLCAAPLGYCVALSDEMCRLSSACIARKQCFAREGACVSDPTQSSALK